MTISLYREEDIDRWDSFIRDSSINGNFLQSRRFLSYHPKGRFEDCSLLYSDKKGNLRGLIPGAIKVTDGKKTFVSHPGSTYGGIVIDEKTLSAKRFQALLDELVNYLASQGFDSIDLRFPPDFMWRRQESPFVEYMLRLNGFEEFIELTTYIDFDCYKESVLSNFSQGKRTNVNNGKKQGLHFELLSTYEDVEKFHWLLSLNLKKFDTVPVHSVDELWDLYSNRLPGETELVGVRNEDGKLLAAGWLFLFGEQNTVHTQYLCADAGYASLSPMTFLYYSCIMYCKERGYRYLSWGISTEDRGSSLNWGLTESKEHFGSLHGVHRGYVRLLAD
ncbi:MAG: GNAT family N-acetyltransferase [Eggerthellaceae bacterium]|nr:GNAT family N-acetyltransferase [Eggerthellaceae bacterium]